MQNMINFGEFISEGAGAGFPVKYCLMLKTVAFIAGKLENQDRFSIDNLIANISLYAFSWPILNFGCYFTFEIIF